MKQLLVLFLLLSGCTINIVDKRLTREEVAQAFKERDAAIKQCVGMINALKNK